MSISPRLRLIKKERTSSYRYASKAKLFLYKISVTIGTRRQLGIATVSTIT